MNKRDKQARTRRPATQTLARLVAIAIGTLVIVSIPILTIVLPDLIRPTLTSEEAMALLFQYDEVEGPNPSPSRDQATTGTITLVAYPRGLDLHPVPDLDAIPEEYREKAREWNRTVDRLLVELMQLAKSAKSIRWTRLEEVRAPLKAIDMRYQTLRDEYLKEFSAEIQKKILADTMNGFAWDGAVERVGIKILAEQKMWWRAARSCKQLEDLERAAGVATAESSERLWDFEVFCYKQDEGGRIHLFLRCLTRGSFNPGNAMPSINRTEKD